MLFLLGMMPLSWIAGFFVTGFLAGGLNSFLITIFVLHVVVDFGILYLVSELVCRLLFRLFITRDAIFAIGFIITVEVAASFWPIYLLLGERETTLLNLWDAWRWRF